MKEARPKGYVVVDFIYMKFHTRQNYSDRESVRGCQGDGVGTRGPEGSFGEMEILYVVMLAMAGDGILCLSSLTRLIKKSEFHCM